MPGPTRTLPFEYSGRWRDTKIKDLAADDRRFMEDRDRQLEDYLAGLDGGCCTAVFSGRVGSGTDIDPAGSVTLTLNHDTGTIAPVGFAGSLAAGMWVVSGLVTCIPTGTATIGRVLVNGSFTAVPSTSGGQFSGGNAHAGADDIFVPFSGILLSPATFSPDVIITNQTDVPVRPASVQGWYHRICNPCAFTVGSGGS